MISNLQIFIISIPVLVLVSNDPMTGLFIRAAVIWMNDLVVICVIFGSLMYSVHFGTKKNVNIGTAVSDYTRRERESTIAAKERKEKFVSRLSSMGSNSCAEPEGASVKRHSSSAGSDVGSVRRISAFSLASHAEKEEKDEEDLSVEDD